MNAPYVEVFTRLPPVPGEGLKDHKEGKGMAVSVKFEGKGPSSLKLKPLEGWFIKYPNRSDTQYLWDGFTLGFRIPFQGKRVPFMSGNLSSVKEMEYVVKKKNW